MLSVYFCSNDAQPRIFKTSILLYFSDMTWLGQWDLIKEYSEKGRKIFVLLTNMLNAPKHFPPFPCS